MAVGQKPGFAVQAWDKSPKGDLPSSWKSKDPDQEHLELCCSGDLVTVSLCLFNVPFQILEVPGRRRQPTAKIHHQASDSDGLQPTSNGLQPNSDLHPNSDGLHSDGLKTKDYEKNCPYGKRVSCPFIIRQVPSG